MSYTRFDEPTYARPWTGTLALALGRFGRVAVWSVVNVGLLFAEQLCEIAAPMLLLSGAVWYAIPKILNAIKLDGQANDVLQMVRTHVPIEFYLNGTYVSADVLISWGLWSIAVVAICRTLSVALGTLLLDRR